MKPLTLTIAASLLLLASPLALAQADHCPETTELQYIADPLNKDKHYFFIDATEPQKLGEWFEDNGNAGLQTAECFRFGILRYLPDVQARVLP